MVNVVAVWIGCAFAVVGARCGRGRRVRRQLPRRTRWRAGPAADHGRRGVGERRAALATARHAATCARFRGCPKPPSAPPVAARRPVESVLHGVRRVDDYAWLRDAAISGRAGAISRRTALLRPRVLLTHGRSRTALFSEMSGRTLPADSSVSWSRGGSVYYTRTVAGRSTRSSARRIVIFAEERLTGRTSASCWTSTTSPAASTTPSSGSANRVRMVAGSPGRSTPTATRSIALRIRDLATGRGRAPIVRERSYDDRAWIGRLATLLLHGADATPTARTRCGGTSSARRPADRAATSWSWPSRTQRYELTVRHHPQRRADPDPAPTAGPPRRSPGCPAGRPATRSRELVWPRRGPASSTTSTTWRGHRARTASCSWSPTTARLSSGSLRTPLRAIGPSRRGPSCSAPDPAHPLGVGRRRSAGSPSSAGRRDADAVPRRASASDSGARPRHPGRRHRPGRSSSRATRTRTAGSVRVRTQSLVAAARVVRRRPGHRGARAGQATRGADVRRRALRHRADLGEGRRRCARPGERWPGTWTRGSTARRPACSGATAPTSRATGRSSIRHWSACSTAAWSTPRPTCAGAASAAGTGGTTAIWRPSTTRSATSWPPRTPWRTAWSTAPGSSRGGCRPAGCCRVRRWGWPRAAGPRSWPRCRSSTA